jgi:hypothetical protein
MKQKNTTDRDLKRAVSRGMKEAREDFLRHARESLEKAHRTGRPSEFSCAFGSHRAWPDGHVTLLDTDGDSIKTVMRGPPVKIVILAPSQLAEILRRKLETGLHGKTLEEVAERILCEAVRP